MSQGDRVPDWLETRSRSHRSIPENPFVVGVWGFRATLYEGEGGALCGALLPITVFLAVKVTGGSGLAPWDRALVGVWPCRSGRSARPRLRVLDLAEELGAWSAAVDADMAGNQIILEFQQLGPVDLG